MSKKLRVIQGGRRSSHFKTRHAGFWLAWILGGLVAVCIEVLAIRSGLRDGDLLLRIAAGLVWSLVIGFLVGVVAYGLYKFSRN